MDPTLIAQLIVQFGIPLTRQIVAWQQEGHKVTLDDFTLMDTLAAYRSTASLTAAGIKIVDGVVVPL